MTTGVGIGGIASSTLLSEFNIKKEKDKDIVMMNQYFVFGSIYVTLLAFLCLDNINSGNWQLLLILTNLIAIPGLFFSIYQNESIIYSLKK